MSAEQLTGFLVENDLYQALILAERNCLAVAYEGKATDPDVELFLFRSLFGQADRCDLRRAIRAAGDHRLVHRVRVEALDRLNANDAFMLGLVGKHRRTCDIADGIDAGNARPAELVDDDGASIRFYTDFLETKIFNVADDADGGDHALDGQRL